MIILHDESSADLAHIQAMAKIEEGFALFDYVSIAQTNGNQWIGQILQPNRNISTVGGRLDPTILHGLQLMQDHTDVQSVDSVQIYDILLLGQYDGQNLLTPRLRPLPGAAVYRLDAEKVGQVIGIPPRQQHKDGSWNIIGELLNAENVPLCISKEKFNYHIMIAGGTGSGKSNAAANIVEQALKFSKCVLIHDAKPDYGFVDRANTDPNVEEIWKQFERYDMVPHKVANVIRVGFYGTCDPDKVDAVVGFHASSFSPELLAGFLFPSSPEINQFEGFAGAAEYLRQQRNKQPYSLDDVLAVVKQRMDAKSTDPELLINDMTGKAILRKATSRRSQMPWLDAVESPTGKRDNRLASSQLNTGQKNKVIPFNFDDYAQLGRLLVIDYRKMDEPAYALLLSYFLRICHEYRKERRAVGIVQLVDEAHRIFDNNSRHSDALAGAFGRVMREGRSLDHSIVMSLQNASQIPPLVMNNLNTKIVMRQNSKHEADAATQTMGRDFSIQSMRLSKGHALVSMYEASSTVLAQMAPSPFELMRSDNTSNEDKAQQTTLGDDLGF